MWNVAKTIWSQLIPVIKALKKPNYSVTICGHSLGAGIAVLINILANFFKPDAQIGAVFSIGIATPACISCSNPKYHENIVSLILGDDIVPRLSFSSVFRLFFSVSIDPIPTKLFFDKVKGRNEIKGKNHHHSRVKNHLLPAGVVFHLNSDLKEFTPKISEVSPKFFEKFAFSSFGLQHHRLDYYRFYLASVLTQQSITHIFS